MGGLECVLTGLSDELKETFGKRVIRREFFTAIVVGSSFLVAIVNFCQVKIFSLPISIMLFYLDHLVFN